jgi:transcriptional regulator with XRE-family HTH domain
MTREEKLYYIDIGKRLRNARNESGLSLAQVGEKIGISRAGVSNIELGNQTISLYQHQRISQALGIEPITDTEIKDLDHGTKRKIKGLIEHLQKLI